MSDLVNHPAHYEEQSIRLEPIDFCERLPFCEGNTLKYCFRAGHKEGSSELQDLKKAQWYLNRSGYFGALELTKEQIGNFEKMMPWLMRAKGIIEQAFMASVRQAGGQHVIAELFWQELYKRINERIDKLENEHDQTDS